MRRLAFRFCYTFDGRGLAGDFVYFEPAQDDEVVVRDIRVTFVND